MSFYTRKYIKKDNFIIRNSLQNLGASTGHEINEDTFYLFEINLAELLNERYKWCLQDPIFNLKIKSNLIDKKCDVDSIFKLSFFDGVFDEGCGYEEPIYCPSGGYSPDTHASNYFYMRNGVDWPYDFETLLNFNVIPYTDFQNEDQELSFDITPHIDQYSLSKSSLSYILQNNGVSAYIYSSETETFFNPYIEIIDQNGIYESDFTLDLKDELELITTPILNIIDDSGDIVYQSSGQCIGPNIFNAVNTYSGETCDKTIRWSNLNDENGTLDDIEYFITTPIKTQKQAPEHIKVSGINYGENIKDKVKTIYIKPFDNKNKIIHGLKTLEYQILTYQGVNEIKLSPWMKVNNTKCQYWFILDSSAFLDQEYYIRYRHNSNFNTFEFKTTTKFFIK